MGDGAAGPGGESFNPAELVCGGCSDVSRAQMCPRHGAEYLEYKCRYCCSVAVFFCFGTTHFCNACHEDFRHMRELPKHALPKCPAGNFEGSLPVSSSSCTVDTAPVLRRTAGSRLGSTLILDY